MSDYNILKGLLKPDRGLSDAERDSLKGVLCMLDCPDDMIEEAVKTEVREYLFEADRDMLQNSNILDRCIDSVSPANIAARIIGEVDDQTGEILSEHIRDLKELQY